MSRNNNKILTPTFYIIFFAVLTIDVSSTTCEVRCKPRVSEQQNTQTDNSKFLEDCTDLIELDSFSNKTAFAVPVASVILISATTHFCPATKVLISRIIKPERLKFLSSVVILT